MMGFTSFFANFVQIAVLMVSWLLVLIAFFILAVQLFVTLIEFKLTTLAGFILIPFALFNKTAFLAEKVLGNIVASGRQGDGARCHRRHRHRPFRAVHHHLRRRPADDRAGAFGRAGGARHAGPGHLRSRHRDRPRLRCPPTRRGRRCGHRPRRRRHGYGRRRRARSGRKGCGRGRVRRCLSRAWRRRDGGRSVLRLQPRLGRPDGRRRRCVRPRRCRPRSSGSRVGTSQTDRPPRARACRRRWASAGRSG